MTTMRLAILSRNPNLYSIRRLKQEARKAKMTCSVINPLNCQLTLCSSEQTLDKSSLHQIIVHSKSLPQFDAVLPRIGTSITAYGLAVVRQFEAQQIFILNGSHAIADSRDKMRCLQLLCRVGLRVPSTVLTRSTRGLRSAVKAVKGLPVVLKILQGTQGVGVMLVHSPVSLGSVMDTLRTLHQDVIIQQFIVEGAGRDYRAFVIGDKVIASMQRTAAAGEFRSNLHRGAKGEWVTLPEEYEKAALKATKALGLHIAGVDLMESHQGPVIIEVNSSPGFEGIEKATHSNIAKKIIQYTKNKIRNTR